MERYLKRSSEVDRFKRHNEELKKATDEARKTKAKKLKLTKPSPLANAPKTSLSGALNTLKSG